MMVIWKGKVTRTKGPGSWRSDAVRWWDEKCANRERGAIELTDSSKCSMLL